MAVSHLTDEEIAGLLNEVEKGAPMKAVCEGAHVSVRTFYRWKRKFEGLPPAGVRQLRALRKENEELRRLLAERGAMTGRAVNLLAVAPAKVDMRKTDGRSREMHGLGLGRFATVRMARES